MKEETMKIKMKMSTKEGFSREHAFSFRASCSLSSRRYFSLKDISLSSFCPSSGHIKAESSYKTEKEVKITENDSYVYKIPRRGRFCADAGVSIVFTKYFFF